MSQSGLETEEQREYLSDSRSSCRERTPSAVRSRHKYNDDESDSYHRKLDEVNEITESLHTSEDMEFDIPLEQWWQIRPVPLKDHYVLSDSWRSYLLDTVSSISNCVIRFGYSRVSHPTSRKRKFPLIRQNASCTFPKCHQFKFIVAKDQTQASGVRLKVTMTAKENHETAQSKFRRTTAPEFQNIADKLVSKDPEEVFEGLI